MSGSLTELAVSAGAQSLLFAPSAEKKGPTYRASSHTPPLRSSLRMTGFHPKPITRADRVEVGLGRLLDCSGAGQRQVRGGIQAGSPTRDMISGCAKMPGPPPV
jgi:hypothetical protein